MQCGGHAIGAWAGSANASSIAATSIGALTSGARSPVARRRDASASVRLGFESVVSATRTRSGTELADSVRNNGRAS